MNCIIVDDEEMSINALKHLISQIPLLNLVGVYRNAGETLNILNSKNVDLMLLDIELPDLNGLEFVRSLKNPPLTILATSKREYGIEAFECNIVDYLIKPVSIDRFFKAIARSKDLFDAFPQNADPATKDYVFVKINGTLSKINVKEILWIEALGDYIRINTTDKKYTIHSTLKAIENKFDSEKFIRVHRSYIVSVDNIDSIDDNTIVIDRQLIPIGYVYKDNLTKRLNLL
jgi:two-component system LytT family response regulator